jgi:sigma-B regulation protein RsbU (phosphoserine phosphatase)
VAIGSGREPLVIENTQTNPLTSHMAITEGLGGGCFIGVPIILSDGRVFGTLCALDTKPYHFKQEDIVMFKTLASHISYVIELEDAQARLSFDLDMAKKVQKSVLTKPIHDKHVQIDAIYQPSDKLSGDMYSWYKIDSHRYGVILLDVMGHGVSASLVGMSLRSLLHYLITTKVEPIEVISDLNKHMMSIYSDDSPTLVPYATIIYLVIDTERKEIAYTNAGHPPGLLLQNGDTIVYLDKGGVPVGLFADMEVKKETISYNSDTRILLYTDGIFEALKETAFAGIDKLKPYLFHSKDLDNRSFIQHVFENGNKLGKVTDDVCVIGISIT